MVHSCPEQRAAAALAGVRRLTLSHTRESELVVAIITDTTDSGPLPIAAQDVESRGMLALSILDHRMSIRDRYEGAQRVEFIRLAIVEAAMALEGESLEAITHYHMAATA